MRRETGVKGWSEKRASEGDRRPSSWSKTQEEKFLVSRRREKKRRRSGRHSLSLGDYKKRSLRGGCKDDDRLAERSKKGRNREAQAGVRLRVEKKQPRRITGADELFFFQ